MELKGSKPQDMERALTLATTAGRLILESGAEIYRVEDTILYLCRSMGYPDAQTVCTPTSVTVTLLVEGRYHTATARVQKRTVDFTQLSAVNDISRMAALQHISCEEALRRLAALPAPGAKGPLQILCAGFAAMGFALMFGGSLAESAISFLAGGASQALGLYLGRVGMGRFNVTLLSSAALALVALGCSRLLSVANLNYVITGAIMPWVPGLALTNAVQDIINGDLTSGVTRGAEALMVAVALAVGIGSMIALWTLTFGGVGIG
jgi:uncharacterized membrane protein YjjP (DUF1212 family)